MVVGSKGSGIFGLRGGTIESDAVSEAAERGQATTNCNGPTVCTDKSN